MSQSASYPATTAYNYTTQDPWGVRRRGIGSSTSPSPSEPSLRAHLIAVHLRDVCRARTHGTHVADRSCLWRGESARECVYDLRLACGRIICWRRQHSVGYSNNSSRVTATATAAAFGGGARSSPQKRCEVIAPMTVVVCARTRRRCRFPPQTARVRVCLCVCIPRGGTAKIIIIIIYDLFPPLPAAAAKNPAAAGSRPYSDRVLCFARAGPTDAPRQLHPYSIQSPRIFNENPKIRWLGNFFSTCPFSLDYPSANVTVHTQRTINPNCNGYQDDETHTHTHTHLVASGFLPISRV